MIEVDGKIVSTEVITQKFLCDLGRCKGICCVEGNAGAPLEADEVRLLAEMYPVFKPYMTERGVAAVERQGFAVIDDDGDLVTPLVGEVGRAEGPAVDGLPATDGECAYSYNENGVTLCAIEKAWAEGRKAKGAGAENRSTGCGSGHAENDGSGAGGGKLGSFRKPVSCHLYPIRVVRFGDGSTGLNYHRWAVCEGARVLGREKGVPMFRMLREAIVRRFGEEFFAALEAAEKYLDRH